MFFCGQGPRKVKIMKKCDLDWIEAGSEASSIIDAVNKDRKIEW